MGSCIMECCLLDKTESARRNSLQLRLPVQEQATQISQQSSMKCQSDLVILLFSFVFLRRKDKKEEGRKGNVLERVQGRAKQSIDRIKGHCAHA